MGEERAWKLFALVPIMLLHRPRNTWSVGRSELAQHVWMILMQAGGLNCSMRLGVRLFALANHSARVTRKPAEELLHRGEWKGAKFQEPDRN